MLVRFVIKQTLGQATARGNGNRRQLNSTGVIANGINPRYAGVLVFINDDVAFFVGFHASNGQVKVIRGWFTTDRPNQAIHRFATAIFQLQGQTAVGVFNDRLRNCVSMQSRTFGVHHLDQRLDDHRIEAAQRRVFTHEQVSFCAQAVNHARQFNGDVACANNGYTFWQRWQLKETIGVDSVFHAWNVRMARAPAGGDQNMIGSNGFTVHFNGFGINEAGKAFNHINVIFTQHVVVRGMNAIDIGGTAGDQFIPVELINGGIETVIRAVHMNRFTDLCGMPHHFLRYAANINAGAA